MILDSTLIESAKARANLSSGALAELLGVAEKTIRRSLQGESLPPSMRLLVQLIAALPWIVPVLERLRAGLPIEADAVVRLMSCPACQGSGGEHGLRCKRCIGSGSIRKLFPSS
jgi:DNA-binding XRE family transcriptional regulator